MNFEFKDFGFYLIDEPYYSEPLCQDKFFVKISWISGGNTHPFSPLGDS